MLILAKKLGSVNPEKSDTLNPKSIGRWLSFDYKTWGRPETTKEWSNSIVKSLNTYSKSYGYSIKLSEKNLNGLR